MREATFVDEALRAPSIVKAQKRWVTLKQNADVECVGGSHASRCQLSLKVFPGVCGTRRSRL